MKLLARFFTLFNGIGVIRSLAILVNRQILRRINQIAREREMKELLDE